METSKITDPLSRDNVFAVIGVSSNKDKWGYKVFRSLLDDGYKVYPINPKYHEIDGITCYPNLESLPEKPDVVITVVPPRITESLVDDIIRVGVPIVWMQPGSESDRAIRSLEDHGIIVVHHTCIVMDGIKRST